MKRWFAAAAFVVLAACGGDQPEDTIELDDDEREITDDEAARLAETLVNNRELGGADFHDLLRPISWKGVKGSARVKTGTMSYARGLAGYIDTATGRRLAFAIFFNDTEKRAALDARFDPVVREIDPASRPWRDRALRLEEKLTSGWAGDN